jgi:tRNA pseudouridine55 synthase
VEKTKLIYKKMGETPLESILRFKSDNPEYKDTKIAYAGRLDPMAHGALLLLLGEECKKRDLYQGFNKVYEFQIIVGVETDAFDILGLPNGKVFQNNYDIENLEISIKNILKSFIGEIEQAYPPYSSFHVNGKPLFWYAKNDLLKTIEIPKHQVRISSLEFVDSMYKTSKELLNEILERIDLVKGDFRQKEIISNWENILSENIEIRLIKFRAEVSSGTYIRQLVKDIADKTNTSLTVFEIYRKSVGEFSL